MKRSVFFVLIAAVLAISTLSAEAQKSGSRKNSPDEKITVKREYDKNGNLTGFDSLRVYSWSSDSSFSFPLNGGWEDFFGKDFFDNNFSGHLWADSIFSFHFPPGMSPFRFFDEEDLFKGFGDKDSSMVRNFMFHNDTSFFMGPRSSLMLPPGFIVPDHKGMQDLEKYFGQQFRSFDNDKFFGNPGDESPFGQFFSPRQKEEWDKMMERQKKEQEEFFKKWNKQKSEKKTEKM